MTQPPFQPLRVTVVILLFSTPVLFLFHTLPAWLLARWRRQQREKEQQRRAAAGQQWKDAARAPGPSGSSSGSLEGQGADGDGSDVGAAGGPVVGGGGSRDAGAAAVAGLARMPSLPGLSRLCDRHPKVGWYMDPHLCMQRSLWLLLSLPSKPQVHSCHSIVTGRARHWRLFFHRAPFIIVSRPASLAAPPAPAAHISKLRDPPAGAPHRGDPGSDFCIPGGDPAAQRGAQAGGPIRHHAGGWLEGGWNARTGLVGWG